MKKWLNTFKFPAPGYAIWYKNKNGEDYIFREYPERLGKICP